MPSIPRAEGILLKLSLIIPCYNEAPNLPALIERCRKVVTDPRIEVVLVDNGSTDGTAAVLETLTAKSPQLRTVRVALNQGYGHGILTGLNEAEGDILAWTHADHQTDPADVLEGLEIFLASKEPENIFVKGRRYGRPFFDRCFTGGMSVFETLLARRLLTDVNAQPTMFHRKFFLTLSDAPNDFALDLYVFWRARQAGLTIKRFDVRFGKRAYGSSHWNTGLKARWKFIRRTIDFSLRLARESR